MSLTLVCMYIVTGLCFLLFVNYKFLKLFVASLNQKFTTDANRNIKISNKNSTFKNENDSGGGGSYIKDQSTWSIPGPLRVPFLGTKWIYLWKYKMSKIHEVYRGEIFYTRIFVYAFLGKVHMSRKIRFSLKYFSNFKYCSSHPFNSFIINIKLEYSCEYSPNSPQ